MKIHNNTLYKYTAFINGREFNLNRNSIIEFECDKPIKIDLISKNKNRVFINILDVFLGLFWGGSTLTIVYCDYSFLIRNCDINEISLKNNSWNPRDQITINSCYADIEVDEENYAIHNFNKIKKKHRNFHLFISSFLPVGIILFILCFLFTNPSVFIILFSAWLGLFGIPSFIEISRLDEFSNQAYVNQTLCRYADELRKGAVYVSEDTSKTGKFIGKILGKMFKFDEEK